MFPKEYVVLKTPWLLQTVRRKTVVKDISLSVKMFCHLPVLGDQGSDGDLLFVKDALGFKVVRNDLGRLHRCTVDLGQVKILIHRMCINALLLNGYSQREQRWEGECPSQCSTWVSCS